MGKVKVVKGVNDLESQFPKIAEEFSEALNGGMSPSEVYAFTGVKFWFKCKQCGNEWSTRVLDRTRNGHGCPECHKKLACTLAAGVAASKRKPNSQFIFEAARLNPDVSIVDRYENSHTRITVRCNRCGKTWTQFPGSTLKGSRCSDCHNNRGSMTMDDVNDRLESDGRTVRVIGEYTKSSEKALIECNVCGQTWKANVQSVLHGCGCPKCAGNMRYTHDTYVEKLSESNPDIEVVGEYSGMKNPVEVKCKKCGYKWVANAKRFIKSSPCPNCGKHITKSFEWLKEAVAKVNRNVVPGDNYKDLTTKMTFKCGRCGNTWDTTPKSILNGTGCPACNVANRSFFEAALLYALRNILGDDAVLSHDKASIGVELDVYVPSMNLAFEPGAWFYHKKIQDSDWAKLVSCSTAGINLDIIYFGIPENEIVDYACIRTDVKLSAQKWDECKDIIKNVLDRHAIGYEDVDWEAVRKSALLVSGRKTTDEFKDELSKVNPNIEVLGEYKQNHIPISVKCQKCGHEWIAEPNNLLDGKGCPICRRKDAGLRLRKTHDEFARELAEKNPKVILTGTYVSSADKVEVKCVRCGRTFMSMPGNLLNGRGCIACRHKKTQEQFEEDLKKNNPNVTPLGEYEGANKPIRVKCAVCGHVWDTKPRWLKEGHGCSKCGRDSTAKKLSNSHEKFLGSLKEKGIDVKVIGKYQNAKKKIEFECKECGNHWYATPSNILSGKGCPECGKKKSANGKRLTTEEFRRRMSDAHDDIEVIGEYRGCREPVEVMCKKCGHTWSATPTNLIKSKGCSKCRKRKA